MSSGTYVFLSIIIIYISDIVTAFWRYISVIFYYFLEIYISDILLLSGDVEINPDTDPGYLNSLSSCYGNLNSIAAHNFVKMSLLQVYNAINRFDIICLSETSSENSYHTDDDQLTFPGYNLITADNPIKSFFWKPSRPSSEYLSDTKPAE